MRHEFTGAFKSGQSTLLVKEEDMLESNVISGVTCAKDEAKITLIGISDQPGIAARAVRPLADAGITIDMIVQNVTPDGRNTDLTFTVPRADMPRALKAIQNSADIHSKDILTDDKVAKVSIIGIGMRAHPEVPLKMFETLAAENINIKAISTSEIKISVLIGEDDAEKAVRALHAAFSLDSGI